MSTIETTVAATSEFVAKMNGKQKFLYIIGIFLALVVLAPTIAIAYAAVTNLVSLILLVAGVVAFGVAAPMLLRKWKNKVLQMMISEAQLNPIITLRQQSLERHTALNNAKVAASAMVGKLNSLRDSLVEFREKHKKESGSRKIYDRMLPLVKKVQERITTAEKVLEQFDHKIDEKSDEWEIMIKAGHLKKQLRDAGATDPLELILADTAFTAVRDAVNDELAQLDALLADEGLNEIRELPDASSNILNLTAVELADDETEEVVPRVRSRKSR